MAYPVSARWEQHLRRGASPVTECDVVLPGQGVVFSNLPVSSGSISFDRDNAYRGSGSVVVADPDLFPTLDNPSVLEPYGAEIVVRTGIVYPEGIGDLRAGISASDLAAQGAAELVPMGVFPIQSVSGSEREGRIATVNFYDRGKRLEDFSFVSPKDVGGELIQDVIENEILDSDPFFAGVDWVVHFSPDLENFALPFGTLIDKGRWEFLEEMAQSLGAEIFFYRDGDAYVVPVPGIYAAGTIPDPDWVIDAGEEGILKDVSRSVSRDGVYNGVVVVGSADEERAQPYALVTDDDALSLTRWGGPFGKSLLRIENSALTTTTQCEIAARAELRNRTGLQRSLDFEAVGNPAMDPGDIIKIVFPDGSEETHMLDGYSYSFGSMDLRASTRSIQYIPPEST